MELTVSEAFSGIFGSISLAAWVFLLLPQLYENYSAQSGEGISLLFLFIWASGDVFNLTGAIWAGLVPTVIALAVYFCISDSVLILQCLYYRHIVRTKGERGSAAATGAGAPTETSAVSTANDGAADEEDEEQPLLDRHNSHRSYSSVGPSGSHKRTRATSTASSIPLDPTVEQPSLIRFSLVNAGCLLAVCAVGALGWLICYKTGIWTPVPPPNQSPDEHESTPYGAEILGYLSAILYLGARIPQIYKNWKEKSCEGLSLLFFLFSVLGNLTYGAGILAHSLEKQYVVANIPWLLGSLGTLVEDLTIFIQFRLYRNHTSHP